MKIEDKARYKLLDCGRKALLNLPANALKLWLLYWLNEDDDQESFMSLETIESQLNARMGRRTIITWTQWLVTNRWLIDTGKKAAEKWIALGKTPTPGSHQVKVYRVDDPTSANSAPVQIAHKVSCSIGLISGSDSDSVVGPSPSSSNLNVQVNEDETATPGKPMGQPKNPKTRKPKAAPDGTPYPDEFDSTWDNTRRLTWLSQHGWNESGSAVPNKRAKGKTKPRTPEDITRRNMESILERDIRNMEEL